MEKQKVGIVGVGMVGGALRAYFEKTGKYDLFLYDRKGIGSLDEVNKAEFVYLCLPTPYVEGKGCDTSLIEQGLAALSGRKVVVIKSTVIPGTTDNLQAKFPQHKLLFNPEFLTEETADHDMGFPDRQILGYTPQSYTVAADVLLQLPLAPYERLVPAKIAEMIKYAGNTWFAVKVAMNNELYDLAKNIGFSEEEWEATVSGVAADKRVGRTHLTVMHKGKRGYHGKCLPKDIKALLEFSQQFGVDMPVRRAANQYNDALLKQQGLSEYI
jgi:UDPglucose 6-dehydrogenase